MNLMTGDIVFVMHHNNFISKVIGWAMGSKWSHSAIVYGEFDGKTLLCETSDFEVTLNWFDRYVKDHNTTIEVYRHENYYNVISGNEAQIKDTCDNLLGKMYGYLQLISLGIRRAFKLHIPNFINSGLVCCHVVGYALKNVKGSAIDQLEPEEFDTEELYQYIKSNGWVVVYSKVK